MPARNPDRGVLVVGLGNSLSGDDGFGSRVITRLRQEPGSVLNPADIVDGGVDLLGQLGLFAGRTLIILVDTLLDPEARYGLPGEVVTLSHETLAALESSSRDVHAVSPLLAVQLFLQLNPGIRIRFTLVGLCSDQVIPGAPVWLNEEVVERAVFLIHSICET